MVSNKKLIPTWQGETLFERIALEKRGGQLLQQGEHTDHMISKHLKS